MRMEKDCPYYTTPKRSGDEIGMGRCDDRGVCKTEAGNEFCRTLFKMDDIPNQQILHYVDELCQ